MQYNDGSLTHAFITNGIMKDKNCLRIYSEKGNCHKLTPSHLQLQQQILKLVSTPLCHNFSVSFLGLIQLPGRKLKLFNFQKTKARVLLDKTVSQEALYHLEVIEKNCWSK